MRPIPKISGIKVTCPDILTGLPVWLPNVGPAVPESLLNTLDRLRELVGSEKLRRARLERRGKGWFAQCRMFLELGVTASNKRKKRFLHFPFFPE